MDNNHSKDEAIIDDTVVETVIDTTDDMIDVEVVEDIPAPILNTTKNRSLAHVASHNTPDDCWTAVDGNVYDVSSFVSQHPGGAEKISQVCGNEATEIFGRMHGSNEKAKAALASLQIGVIVQE